MKKMISGLGLLASLSLPSVEAASHEVRFLYQPDSSQPGRNEFVSQTPSTGYCEKYSAKCAERNIFSVHTPIRFNSTRAIAPGDGVGLKAPAGWRKLTVVNQVTQQPETVEVKVAGIGSTYVLSDTAANLTGAAGMFEGHEKLWGMSWFYPPYPCQISGAGVTAPASFGFFWYSPVEGYCNKTAAYAIPSMSFDTVDFAYEVRLPNPLSMLAGLYTGSLTYTLGDSGDFEMGPDMVPDGSHLTFDFVLDVQHTLKVDLPPGGDRVFLEPEGGWRRWIDSGVKPNRIYRDQPFHISASSPFKVMMECAESFTPNECNLRNARADRTSIEVKMSLPTGITLASSGEVKDVSLKHREWIGPFQPERYVDRRPGNLRFEIPEHRIDALLKPGVNDTYSGHLTLLWDSEV